MRITGGSYRGIPLDAPKGRNTRPSADRVRQTVFNVIAHAPWGGNSFIDGARALDIFAGTGAYGLEALSRGAICASFIERDRNAIHTLLSNIRRCNCQEISHVVAEDATKPSLCHKAYTLAFIDPPYRQNLIIPNLDRLAQKGWIDTKTLIIAETAADEVLELGADLLDCRRIGAAQIWIFRYSAQGKQAI